MYFKNPEILYFFWLLIIPIIVHLFQLQKFVKTPFTNVSFLKQIVQDTRKSSRLKKWLILATRLLLFSAILFAFSQPYFGNKKSDITQHNFIYLDNSLSTSTKGNKGDLLQIATQEIIDNASEKDIYTLQTNANFFENLTYNDLKKNLLNLKNTSKKVSFESIFLKIKNNLKNKSSALYKNILLSDFQYKYNKKFTNVTPVFSAVQLISSTKNNVSIDSVDVNANSNGTLSIDINIKNQGEPKKNIPIAIFNGNQLLSKQTFSTDQDTTKKVTFTVQNQNDFLGKIQITYSDTFSFDNEFFFTINSSKKIHVLSIGTPTNYLSKIYTKNEFDFISTTLKKVNYNTISKQQIIILNELEIIPETLAKSLINFSKKGGTLVIIPNTKIQLNSYNNFLRKIGNINLKSKIKDSLKITRINYNHPFFKNVFSKKVTNFQYPFVKEYYPSLAYGNSHIVTLENNKPLISEFKNGTGKIYLFSSPISRSYSNFTNSPLIVPIFYNFAKLSFQHSKLYYYLNSTNNIDVEVSLAKDEILSIKNKEESFIPLQQPYQNKVKITTKDQPSKAGFYNIIHKKDTLSSIAFNNPKEESELNFLDLKTEQLKNKNITAYDTIKEVFKTLNKKNEVQLLWKWFLSLAIVSLLLEILILKFYKP